MINAWIFNKRKEPKICNTCYEILTGKHTITEFRTF